MLTVVGGKVVYAAQEFANRAPPPLRVSPDWSPVKFYGGYAQPEVPLQRLIGDEEGREAVQAYAALPNRGIVSCRLMR